MNKLSFFIIFFLFFLLNTHSASASPLGPSGLIDLPDTSVFEGTSYDTLGDLKYLRYSKAFIFNNLEGGLIKETSSDNYLFFGKMRLLPDMGYIPSFVAGIADINSSLRNASYFVAASKDISSLGVKLHLGNMWWGEFKNIPGSSRVSDWYAGAELSLFNFTLLGEYHREKSNIGVRINLSPGFFVSGFCRGYENNKFDKIDFQVSYGSKF
jgi:hypothetical protein